MAGETKTTTDHDEIRQWAEDRGGRPVLVHGDGLNYDAWVLRIDFLYDKWDDAVQPVSWEKFFEKFDQENRVFVYQTETEGGKISRFGRIISPEQVAQAVIE